MIMAAAATGGKAMASDEALARLLAEFGRGAGIDGLRLDAEGICALAFDERVLLHIAATGPPETAILYASLGALPPGGGEAALYHRMLEANLAAGNGGSTLALDPAGAPILPRPAAVARLSPTQFGALIEQVAEEALAWLDLLRPGGAETPPAGPAALRESA